MRRTFLLLAGISLVGCSQADESVSTETPLAEAPVAETPIVEVVAQAPETDAERERTYPIVDLSEKTFDSVGAINPENQYDNLSKGTIAKASHFIGVGVGSDCTSALIGPNVLLTAAHCVDSGGDTAQGVSFSPRIGVPNPLKFKCTMHPDYLKHEYTYSRRPRSSHDIALCLLQNPRDIPIGTSKIFEVIETNKIPKVNDKILLVGYGCFDTTVVKYYDKHKRKDRYNAGTTGSSDGRMRIGNAVIGETNSLPVFQNSPKYQAYIDSHAKTDDEYAKLCSGDSGGPVFSGASVAAPEGQRRVIAVNSAVGAIPSDEPPVSIHSNLTDLNEGVVVKFIKDYLAANTTAKICGMNVDPGKERCRD